MVVDSTVIQSQFVENWIYKIRIFVFGRWSLTWSSSGGGTITVSVVRAIFGSSWVCRSSSDFFVQLFRKKKFWNKWHRLHDCQMPFLLPSQQCRKHWQKHTKLMPNSSLTLFFHHPLLEGKGCWFFHATLHYFVVVKYQDPNVSLGCCGTKSHGTGSQFRALPVIRAACARLVRYDSLTVFLCQV